MQSNCKIVQIKFIEPTRNIEKKGIALIRAGLEWTPFTTVNDEQAADVSKLIEKLDQDEDVQKVFHNMG